MHVSFQVCVGIYFTYHMSKFLRVQAYTAAAAALSIDHRHQLQFIICLCMKCEYTVVYCFVAGHAVLSVW